PAQPRLDQRLVRQALGHERQRHVDGLPECHLMAQAPFLALRPRRCEDSLLDELQHRLRLGLTGLRRRIGHPPRPTGPLRPRIAPSPRRVAPPPPPPRPPPPVCRGRLPPPPPPPPAGRPPPRAPPGRVGGAPPPGRPPPPPPAAPGSARRPGSDAGPRPPQ